MVAQAKTPQDNLRTFDAIPLDNQTFTQEQLNLANKARSSLFPWRGQFSPELIALLLKTYSTIESVILDPFVGSGTTLFEAARKQRACYGGEIHPAAFAMASTSHFAYVAPIQREEIIQAAQPYLAHPTIPQQLDLFCQQEHRNGGGYGNRSMTSRFALDALLPIQPDTLSYDTYISSLLINTLIRATTITKHPTPATLLQAFEEHSQIVRRLPYTAVPCQAMLGDARTIPLPEQSIDLVIGSPPYLNVFNYHQNYRQTMETVGWDMLDVARSEIGANRKHRQNRFLTVIQYALDMHMVFEHLKRLVRPKGRVILIVGRESRIRGVPFHNAQLVAALGSQAGMVLDNRQERWFINKFGTPIYEDLLYFHPTHPSDYSNDPMASMASMEDARTLAIAFLQQSAQSVDSPIFDEVMAAVQQAPSVAPSSLFTAPSSLPLSEELFLPKTGIPKDVRYTTP